MGNKVGLTLPFDKRFDLKDIEEVDLIETFLVLADFDSGSSGLLDSKLHWTIVRCGLAKFYCTYLTWSGPLLQLLMCVDPSVSLICRRKAYIGVR